MAGSSSDLDVLPALSSRLGRPNALRTRQEAAHQLASFLASKRSWSKAEIAGALESFDQAALSLVDLAEDAEGSKHGALTVQLVLSCITNLPDVDLKDSGSMALSEIIVQALLSSSVQSDRTLQGYALAAAFNRSTASAPGEAVALARRLVETGCDTLLKEERNAGTLSEIDAKCAAESTPKRNSLRRWLRSIPHAPRLPFERDLRSLLPCTSRLSTLTLWHVDDHHTPTYTYSQVRGGDPKERAVAQAQEEKPRRGGPGRWRGQGPGLGFGCPRDRRGSASHLGSQLRRRHRLCGRPRSHIGLGPASTGAPGRDARSRPRWRPSTTRTKTEPRQRDAGGD